MMSSLKIKPPFPVPLVLTAHTRVIGVMNGATWMVDAQHDARPGKRPD